MKNVVYAINTTHGDVIMRLTARQRALSYTVELFCRYGNITSSLSLSASAEDSGLNFSDAPANTILAIQDGKDITTELVKEAQELIATVQHYRDKEEIKDVV